MFQISRSSIFVVLPFLLWGTSMVAIKAIIPQTEPLFIAAIRLIPSGILLVGLASYLGRSQPQTWRAWLWITLFGLVDGTLFQGFLAFGLARTDAGLGSLLIDSQPLAVAVMAALFYKERIGKIGIIGLGVGFLGIGLIGLPAQLWQFVLVGDFEKIWELGVFNLGEWLMLGASLAMAVGTILIRPVVQNADPIAATGWHMIIGGLPLLLLSNQTETSVWQGLDTWGWLGMAYMSVMGGAIAYGLFFYLASSGNLTRLSALTFSTPVFAIVFGRIFLDETLTQIQWLGVLLTLTSIYMVSGRNVEDRELDKADNLREVGGAISNPETILTKP
jgi:drug/metabolite transporter (DMT)-like permease